MKTSIRSLFDAVYRHYPRNIPADDIAYKASEEYQRLAKARRDAGSGERQSVWWAFQRRVEERFPETTVQNMSIHLPTGAHDAGYSARIALPEDKVPRRASIGVLISFLVPCYVLHRWHFEEAAPDPEMIARAAQSRTFYLGDTMYVVGLDHPAAPFIPPTEIGPRPEQVQGFDFFVEEQLYADWLAQEIESTWSAERMPPEIGRLRVPDVSIAGRLPGEATLYDCLFTDQW